LLSAKGHRVTLWGRDVKLQQAIRSTRVNNKYLPGVELDPQLVAADRMQDALGGAQVVVFAVPAQQFRSALTDAAEFLGADPIIVNVAKGIERGTSKTISMIAAELLPDQRYVVLSGPSHAEEVGRGLPTTVAVASSDAEAADFVQELFMTERFRVYTNDDVLGLELGGSLKNIIALGAGISDGMGFGDNTKAALMTRGIAEMVRLGVRLGAKADTFYGLAGIGDLIVTCTSMHSRNRRCGIMLGEGIAPDEAVKRVGMVVEGIFTAEAAVELAKREGVEMPITENIYKVVKGEIDPQVALKDLMTRPRKHESEPACGL
jgi:glycerol-3-phosphate dehydrogenase (NAD(P)+)